MREPVDAARLHAVLEYARMNYDWVVIDLPVVFQRLSLMTDLRVRPGLPGLDLRAAEPAPGAQSGQFARSVGFSQGTVSDHDEPHQQARRNRRSGLRKTV